MTPKELRRVERRLEQFLTTCFRGMGRSERREALGQYLRGLLLDGERKSVVPMATRLVDDAGLVGGMRQRLQQAVCVASWSDELLFRRLAKAGLRGLGPVDALVVDDTGFPKKGRHSVGVQRQYSGTMGRIDNCQIATSLHLASQAGGICIGMQLYLPRQWAESPRRREKAGIPDEVQFNEKWKTALELLERAQSWRLSRMPRIVVADAGFGDVGAFRAGLRDLGLCYVVGIASGPAVWPPGVSPLPPPDRKPGQTGRPKTKWSYPKTGQRPVSIGELSKTLSRSDFRRVTWGEGTKGKQSSRFAFLRIRTAHRHPYNPPGEEEWLIMEWPDRADHPTTFYLSNLPVETPRKRLVYLAKVRWRIERDYQEMKGELGLDHFEGRGWRGFHHHVACVAAAHAFISIERALFPPQPHHVSGISPDAPDGPAEDHRALPYVWPQHEETAPDGASVAM